MQIKDELEPLTVGETLDLAYWREAMEKKYQSLIHNVTWELVSLPPNRTVVSGK